MNWYYVENGQQKGPVTQDQLDELARQGTIKADSLVWTDGKANWLPYSQARPGSGAAQAAAVTGAAYSSALPGGLDADAVAKQKVGGPAVGIIVCGALGLAGVLFSLLSLLAPAPDLSQLPPGMEWVKTWTEMSRGPIAIASAGLNLAVGVLSIVAGLKMKRLTGHGLAVAAAILNIIPLTNGCCCVGLPIGIWALVVLMNSQVKSSFR